ncbi:MAG: enoyl-CoA hydratase/isomerase family protein [Leptospiraceae bacterium]|nr:enoyl-CoA hydratase/isomerase family protein [Leptospiraceae bacterium]
MEFKHLKVTKQEKIVTVEISRPEALNALNKDLLIELESCIAHLERDNTNRVVIITGSGKAFVAGADIAAMKEYDYQKAYEFGGLGQVVFTNIERSRLVIIAAINGFALGGGLELALACDIRIASKNAKLGLPEVGLGLIPGFGGTQRLPRLIGTGLAKEIIFTADMITAEEAYRIGLVNKLVESADLIPTATAMANSICTRSSHAVKEAKRVIWEGLEASQDEGMRLEQKAFGFIFNDKETQEGLSAFLEKRKPNF